ncbi:MAG: hypothetical protein AB7I27_17070 [Bacteriovoracaceae bacterium]
MKFILLISLMAVSSSFADVTPDQVNSMLDQMVRENVISKEEADKARIRMKTMNNEQWSAINQQASKAAGRNPASVVPSENKIEEVNNIDLDSAQFKQIQSDMKKIVPDFKD